MSPRSGTQARSSPRSRASSYSRSRAGSSGSLERELGPGLGLGGERKPPGGSGGAGQPPPSPIQEGDVEDPSPTAAVDGRKADALELPDAGGSEEGGAGGESGGDAVGLGGEAGLMEVLGRVSSEDTGSTGEVPEREQEGECGVGELRASTLRPRGEAGARSRVSSGYSYDTPKHSYAVL